MKPIEISIHPTEVKSLHFDNNMMGKNGEPMKLAVRNGVSIQLNPNTPTLAVVFSKFEAADEKKGIHLVIETLTPIRTSQFVDNLDEIIKTQYLQHIALAVGEKVRACAASVGMTLTAPPAKFNYVSGGPTGSSLEEDIAKALN
ncbi:MAG: hypothetical protein ACI4DU_06590 [Lachnospiraceae bacterium]